MPDSTIHVVGAGLAGLAAAVSLSETPVRVVVHEAAGQAGGRCRSYHDPSLGMTIDNGNHLLLSGNKAALAYLHAIGAEDRLTGPATAEFPFIDLATNERWTLRANDGPVPSWIFERARRVPGTRAIDYLALLRVLWSGKDRPLSQVMRCEGPLYERLWQPILLAALNTDPKEASARLAAKVLRETLLAGGAACHPLIARDGLAHAFIDPAVRYLQAAGIPVRTGHRLRAIAFNGNRVAALDFGDDRIPLSPADAVILAVPAPNANALVPSLEMPTEHRAIVNAHFRVPAPAGFPPMLGVVNGLTQWIFSFPERLSVTISAADALLDKPREVLARDIWREVARITSLPAQMPAWQVVRERRATFAALPRENIKRPAAQGQWANLVLAGDWTDTGLPATIEGAVRSGQRAAQCVSKWQIL